MGMEINSNTINKFKPCYNFQDNSNLINSIKIDNEVIVTSSDDDSLHMYEIKKDGIKLKTTAYCKRYGCNLATFGHSKEILLLASKGKNVTFDSDVRT